MAFLSGKDKVCGYKGCESTNICACGYCNEHHFMSIPLKVENLATLGAAIGSPLESALENVEESGDLGPEINMYRIAIILYNLGATIEDAQAILDLCHKYKGM
jgi:hypothetical protein